MGNFSSEINNLLQLMDTCWKDTVSEWKDAKGREFEGKYIQPLKENAQLLKVSFENVENIVSQAKKNIK